MEPDCGMKSTSNSDNNLIAMANVKHEIIEQEHISPSKQTPDSGEVHSSIKSSEKYPQFRSELETKSLALSKAWTDLNDLLGEYKSELYKAETDIPGSNSVGLDKLKNELDEKEMENLSLRQQFESLQTLYEESKLEIAVKDSLIKKYQDDLLQKDSHIHLLKKQQDDKYQKDSQIQLLKKYQDDLLQKDVQIQSATSMICKLENKLRLLEDTSSSDNLPHKVMKTSISDNVHSSPSTATKSFKPGPKPGYRPGPKHTKLQHKQIHTPPTPSQQPSTSHKEADSPIVCIEVEDDDVISDVQQAAESSANQLQQQQEDVKPEADDSLFMEVYTDNSMEEAQLRESYHAEGIEEDQYNNSGDYSEVLNAESSHPASQIPHQRMGYVNKFESSDSEADVEEDDDVEEFGIVNVNTHRKTHGDVKLLSTFLVQQKNIDAPVEALDPATLNDILVDFFSQIRKPDGSEYQPSTLQGMLASFRRYLKRMDYSEDVSTSSTFNKTRRILKQCRLMNKSYGAKLRRYRIFSKDEVELIFERNLFSLDSPESLQALVFYNNSLHFGFFGPIESRALKWGDISLQVDDNGREYLECRVLSRTFLRKNRFGLATRQVLYGSSDSPNDPKDPICAYKKFAQKRHPGANDPEKPFYLTVNRSWRDYGFWWYNDQALGRNAIGSLMRTVARKSGLSTGKVANFYPQSDT